MLAVDFGVRDDDAEAAEIEGDGARRQGSELLPAVAGGIVGMDATDDDDGVWTSGQLFGQRGEEFGAIAVDEDGRGAGGGSEEVASRVSILQAKEDCRGSCGGDVGFDGGGGSMEEECGGFCPVGEAEEESEVLGGESADGVVLVEACDAGDEGRS